MPKPFSAGDRVAAFGFNGGCTGVIRCRQNSNAKGGYIYEVELDNNNKNAIPLALNARLWFLHHELEPRHN